MIYHPRLHTEDHPAAMFGLIIGTLAVLMAVLVLSMYFRADDARRTGHGLPIQIQHPQR